MKYKKEVLIGYFWNKKRYYEGFMQNVHNFCAVSFLIEANWFDSLSEEEQQKVWERETHASYMRSMVLGGGYPD